MKIHLMQAVSDQILGEYMGKKVCIKKGDIVLINDEGNSKELSVIHKIFRRIPREFFRELPDNLLCDGD